MSGQCEPGYVPDITGKCQLDCNVATCRKLFTNKACKCYADLSEIEDLQFDTEAKKIQAINSTQICAYEGDDGFLFPCDPGCCISKCPGQCFGVAPRPPDGKYTPDMKPKPKSRKASNLFIFWIIMTLFLFILTIL